MKNLRMARLLSLGLLATTLLVISCGKKKTDEEGVPGPTPPPNTQPVPNNPYAHPNYPSYDVNSQPVLIRIHRFASGETRVECLNNMNREVGCGNVMQQLNAQLNPYLPFEEINIAGFGYGQPYQNQFQGWQQYPMTQYPSYPGGTYTPYPDQPQYAPNTYYQYR